MLLYSICPYIAITALYQLKYKLVTKMTNSVCTSKNQFCRTISLCSYGNIFFVAFCFFCIEYIIWQYTRTSADVFKAPVPPMSSCMEIVLFYIDTGQRSELFSELLSLFFSTLGYLAIFPLCSKTSPDMSFLLVYFKYVLYFFV